MAVAVSSSALPFNCRVWVMAGTRTVSPWRSVVEFPLLSVISISPFKHMMMRND